MGFRLTIEGEVVTTELMEKNIETCEYISDSPDDANAKATDFSCILKITGKILTAQNGAAADATMNISEWSLVPAEVADAYRNVTLRVVAAGLEVRKFNLPNAFIIDYHEKFGHVNGVGTFVLLLKQKKDMNPDVTIVGGYPDGDA